MTTTRKAKGKKPTLRERARLAVRKEGYLPDHWPTMVLFYMRGFRDGKSGKRI